MKGYFMKSKNIIEFKNIYVNYGINFSALKNVNLQICNNENWAILGANGCGKSTLIKLISNDLYPNTKYPFSKKIFGEDNWNIFELKKKLGIITNDLHNYYSNQGKYSTAYDVILSGFQSSIQIYDYQVYSKGEHEKVMEVMDFLEISHIKYKKVSEMSTGQLRKCIIGRALIHNPKAFILDEPTVGLDIKAQCNFIDLIRKLSKTSSIILVTHHIEEIFPEITHVALVYKNTIYKQGKKDDILNSENLSEIFEFDIELKKENDKYYIKSLF
jgi:iron complex transport system ATP-binding protein